MLLKIKKYNEDEFKYVEIDFINRKEFNYENIKEDLEENNQSLLILLDFIEDFRSAETIEEKILAASALLAYIKKIYDIEYLIDAHAIRRIIETTVDYLDEIESINIIES